MHLFILSFDGLYFLSIYSTVPPMLATGNTKLNHTQKHKLLLSPLYLRVKNKISVILCITQVSSTLLLYRDVCKRHDRQFSTFHHPRKKSCTLQQPFSYLPVPPAQSTTHLLSVSVDLSVLDIPYKWNHTMWHFVSDLFRSALCFQDAPTL